MILNGILEYFRFWKISFLGWFKVLIRLFFYLFDWARSRTIFELFFLALLFLQFFFSMRPWYAYEINFSNQPETILVSIKINLYVIILSLIPILISLGEKTPSVSKWIFGMQFLVGVILAIGYFFPNPFFIDFINEKDYKFHANGYYFAEFWTAAFLFNAYDMIRKKRAKA